MLKLYHAAPFANSGKVLIALKEKGLPFELRGENVWDRREEFLKLNPACTVPVLVEADLMPERDDVLLGRAGIH